MNKKKLLIFGLDMTLVVLAISTRWISGLMMRWIPPCPSLELGLLCPACGGTRCVRYLASGQIVDAFRMNPYFFVSILYLGVLLMLLNSSVLFGKGSKLLKKLATPTAAIIWAIGLIPFTILRNII